MVINIAFDQEFGNLGMLGRQGENEETRILIDCRSVLEEHPDAVIGVRYMGRVPGEEYYDLSVTDAGDGVYAVVLSTYDLRLDGNKELQVRALEGEWERKSRRFYGYVAKSLFDFRPPAGPVSDYLARLMAALSKAEDAQMQGPVIGENGHWYIFDGGAYVDTGVKAEGRDGSDGYSPTLTAERMEDGVKLTVTMKGGLQETFWVYDGKNGEDAVSPTVDVEEIEGGHRITIADINGEKSFDVMDGKDGQGSTLTAATAMHTYKTEDIGELAHAPADYTAWCPGNLRWDKTLGKFVSLLYAAPGHVHSASDLYVSHIDPNAFVASDPVKCKYVDTDGVTDITPANAGACSFLILSDGTYLMIQTAEDGNTYKFTSADNGVTWQKVSAVTGFSGNPWNMTELSNGRIIMSDDEAKVGLYYSDDKGVNWTQVIPATVGGDYEAEACVLEVQPGKLIAIARYSVSGKGYYESGDSEAAIFAWSADYGTTWTAWQKSSIDNMNASSCTGLVHDGIVEVFAASRWYSNGGNVNTDNANTGKNGGLIHYMATAENALQDKFTRVGIVDYAKGAGGEYHAPCAALDDKERMLLVHMDGGESTTCANRYLRGELDGLNYQCTTDGQSTVKAYCAKHTQSLFDAVNEEIAYIKYVLSNMGGDITPDAGTWMTVRSWDADTSQPDTFIESTGSEFSDVIGTKSNPTQYCSFLQDDRGEYYEKRYTQSIRIVPNDGVQDFGLVTRQCTTNLTGYSYCMIHKDGLVTALMIGAGGGLKDINNGNNNISASQPSINTHKTLELYAGKVVYDGVEYEMVQSKPAEFIANATNAHASYAAAFYSAAINNPGQAAAAFDVDADFAENYVAAYWASYTGMYEMAYKEMK